MKNKYLLLFVFLLTGICSFAQNKITKYCEVVTGYSGGFSSRFIVEIDLGKVDSLFLLKDNQIKVQLQKVKTLKTNTDVLNYMSSLHWFLVVIVANGQLKGDMHFYFKKEFDPSELLTTKDQ